MIKSTISEREREHFDAMALERGAVWWGAVTKAGQLRLDERAALAIKYAELIPGKYVLEPGSGNGEYTKRIATSGATIMGVEISPYQVEIANKRLVEMPNVQVIEGDISQLNFPDNTFDAVVGNGVLHHLDLSPALSEMVRVLKPGGTFFFTECNMFNPQVAAEKNIGFIRRATQNTEDETAFFRWQIAAILKQHGFEQIRVKPFEFIHAGTPDFLVPLVHKLSNFLSKVPLINEVGETLQISANLKPI